MRITKIDRNPGHVGVVSHESDFEPLMLTLSGPELAGLVNGQNPEFAFKAGVLHTVTLFPPEMPEEERSKFMEACAGRGTVFPGQTPEPEPAQADKD